MRIVFVNSAWAESWGGGEKWTVEAAAWFKQRGNEVLVVGRPNSRLIAAARKRGLTAVETPFGGDFDPLAFKRAYSILKSLRANLAVVNFNKEAWQFGMAARSYGIPVLARHGYPVLSQKLHHRLLLGLLSKLVVNADSIRRHYESLGLPVWDIDVIHNGTASVARKPGALRRRFNIPPETRLVIGAGRLESQKRFDIFIRVAEKLLREQPNLQFLIAGDGPLQESLTAQIQEAGLQDRVRLIGFLPDFAEVVCDADLFLLTSENEGTPNVLLEAMAAAVPCVSFSVGAVPEILTGSLKADCIAAGDANAMTNRALELLQNEAQRQQSAAECAERIRQEFTLDVSMQRFEQLFLKLTGTPA